MCLRERDRESVCERESVCVSVCEREIESANRADISYDESTSNRDRNSSSVGFSWECVFMCERERECVCV